MYLAEKSL